MTNHVFDQHQFSEWQKIIDKMKYDEVKQIVDSIADARIKDIIKQRCDGVVCKVLARKYGITPQRVSQLFYEGIAIVRERLKE